MLKFAAVAILAFACVGLAKGQTSDLQCRAEARTAGLKAKREFVENYAGASSSLQIENYVDAIQLANAATPHAADAEQLSALLQIKAAAYFGLGDKTGLAAALDAVESLNCVREKQRPQMQRLREKLRNMS